METTEITINGKKVTTSGKNTILQAARENGFYIPNMCYDPRLVPYGGCRLCLVEVEGVPKLLAACSTPVTKDMIVHTETEKLAKARRTVLELLLVHHPLDCPVCDKAGECDLQDLAFKYGPSESRFKAKRKKAPEALKAPIVERNSNRCILCGRCVRICTEHQGVGAINLIGRGFETVVSPAFGETLHCEFCGQCIDACPVGALGSKTFRYKARVWMMQEHENVCSHCGTGCTMSLGVKEDKVMRSRGKYGVGINKGDLCGRGRFGFDYVHSEKRLRTPLIRKDGELVPASWDEALSLVGKKLSDIKEKHGAKAIGALGSQRCTLEDNYVLQRFMRETIGSGNLDSTASLGYSKAREAMKQAFGLDLNPIDAEAPLKADAILIVESDITSTHPVYGIRFIEAVRQNGAKLIVADPRTSKLAKHSTDWLRIKPGTGVALLNGMMKVMIDESLASANASQIPEFEALKGSLEEYTPERVSEITGVDAGRITDASKVFASASNRLLVMSMQGSENAKGRDTVSAAANLVMLAGSGPEALQVPAEHANTIGLLQAGVRPDTGPGLKDAKGKGIGLDGMLYGGNTLKALYVMGSNPAATLPDASKVRGVIEGLGLLVVQDIAMTETARLADVVLPASAWSEKEGTFIGATGVPQRVSKSIPAFGESRPDWMILRDISKKMGKDLDIESYVALHNEVMGIVDSGAGPVSATLKFNPVKYEPGEASDPDFPYVMVTGVVLHHSGSLTSMSGNLCSVVPDAFVKINAVDADKMSIRNDDFVRVSSKTGEVVLRARVSDDVREGMLFVPSHFPHADVNALTGFSSNGIPSMVAARVVSARVAK